ncbi:hypothetical protein [Streptomyces sp. NPDC002851]
MHGEEEEWLATQRPSRVREVQTGRLAWTEIDLIDIEGGFAHPLRDGLEVFGVHVNYLRVGQPRHLVAALDGARPIAPYVIVSCHGDEGRILMDDVAEELSRFQPFNGAIGPDRVREHFRLPGSVTFVTGCDTGSLRSPTPSSTPAPASISPLGAPRSAMRACSPRCSSSTSSPNNAPPWRPSNACVRTMTNLPCGSSIDADPKACGPSGRTLREAHGGVAEGTGPVSDTDVGRQDRRGLQIPLIDHLEQGGAPSPARR